jgi:hypothetical protein
LRLGCGFFCAVCARANVFVCGRRKLSADVVTGSGIATGQAELLSQIGILRFQFLDE